MSALGRSGFTILEFSPGLEKTSILGRNRQVGGQEILFNFYYSLLIEICPRPVREIMQEPVKQVSNKSFYFSLITNSTEEILFRPKGHQYRTGPDKPVSDKLFLVKVGEI